MICIPNNNNTAKNGKLVNTKCAINISVVPFSDNVKDKVKL